MKVSHPSQTVSIQEMSELGTPAGNLRPTLPRLFERDSLPHNILRGTILLGYPGRDVTELPNFGVFSGSDPRNDADTEAHSLLSGTFTQIAGVPSS